MRFWIILMLSMTISGCSIGPLAESVLYPSVDVNKKYPPLPKGTAPFEERDLDGIYAYLNNDPESKVVVVYMGGNAETLSNSIPLLDVFAQMKLAFVMADYPSFGHSQGKPNEASLTEAGKSALILARDIANGRPIILIGRSLGAAVALQSYDVTVSKLILISPWTTFEEAAKAMSWLGKFIPKDFLEKNKYDSRSAIKKVISPTLILHGTKDDLIPFTMGQELSLLPRGPARLVSLHGAGHNDVYGREELWREINLFLHE